MLLLSIALLSLADTPPADQPRICRTEQKTGTRVSRNRVCMTKAEWTEKERLARLERMQGIGMTQSRRQDGPVGEIGF